MDFEIELNDAYIHNLTDEEEGALAKNILKRLTRVERKAKKFLSNDRVNVRTGRLRSSVHAELFRRNGEIGGRVGTDVFYGRYLNDGTKNEDGTQRIRPRHWLTDAFDAAE